MMTYFSPSFHATVGNQSIGEREFALTVFAVDLVVDKNLNCCSHVSPHIFERNDEGKMAKAFSHREKILSTQGPQLSVRCFHFHWQWKHQTSVSSMPTNKDEISGGKLIDWQPKKTIQSLFQGEWNWRLSVTELPAMALRIQLIARLKLNRFSVQRCRTWFIDSHFVARWQRKLVTKISSDNNRKVAVSCHFEASTRQSVEAL